MSSLVVIVVVPVPLIGAFTPAGERNGTNLIPGR
jgi:hypothetical protein